MGTGDGQTASVARRPSHSVDPDRVLKPSDASRVVLLALVVGLGGSSCTGTNFVVLVRTPTVSSQKGVYVRLIPEGRRLCDGDIFYGRTDENGRVRVVTKAPGVDARLVVSAPGLRTYEQVMEGGEEGPIRVRLEPSSVPKPENPCGEAVYRFFRAWVDLDVETARGLLADPSRMVPHDRTPIETVPWAIALDSSEIDGDGCRAQASFWFEDACVHGWQIELLRREGNWRIRNVQRSPES